MALALALALGSPGALFGRTMEQAEFVWSELGKETTLRVLYSPPFLRVENPAARFSLVAMLESQEFIGLEHRDGRYWRFSWAEVQATVQESRRNAHRLNSPLVVEQATPAPEPPPEPKAWEKTNSTGTIAGLATTTYESRDARGRVTQLWCSTMPGGASFELWREFIRVRHLLALVAVRPLGPPLDPEHFQRLPAMAGVPLRLIVGEDEKSDPSLSLRGVRRLSYDPDLFLPPRTYRLDPLVAIEGLIQQSP